MPNKYYSSITSEISMAAMLDGRMFRWLYHGSLAVDGTKDFLFFMPADKTLIFHGRELSGGGASIRLDVFTNPDFSDSGTDFNNYINLNPDTGITPVATVTEDPVLTNDGLLIDVDLIFGGSGVGQRGSSGSGTSREFPRIIPKSQILLARLTHLGDSADPAEVLYKLFWEEI